MWQISPAQIFAKQKYRIIDTSDLFLAPQCIFGKAFQKIKFLFVLKRVTVFKSLNKKINLSGLGGRSFQHSSSHYLTCSKMFTVTFCIFSWHLGYLIVWCCKAIWIKVLHAAQNPLITDNINYCHFLTICSCVRACAHGLFRYGWELQSQAHASTADNSYFTLQSFPR